MPLYEYQCDACGHRFERIQKFSDPLVAVCPKCGGPVQKLFSSPAFQFKGSGWYVTDYAKPSDSEKEKRSAGDGTAPEKPEKPEKKEKESSAAESDTKDKGKESSAKESATGDSGAKESGAKEGGGASKEAPADKPAAKTSSKEPS